MPPRGYTGGPGYPVQGPLLGPTDLLRVVGYDFGMALWDFARTAARFVWGLLVLGLGFTATVIAYAPFFLGVLLLLAGAMFGRKVSMEANNLALVRYIAEGCAEDPYQEAMKCMQ